jgi:hypothetical protein
MLSFLIIPQLPKSSLRSANHVPQSGLNVNYSVGTIFFLVERIIERIILPAPAPYRNFFLKTGGGLLDSIQETLLSNL